MVPRGLGAQSVGTTAALVSGDPTGGSRPRGLERLGRVMARRRWWVIGAWLLAIAALLVPASHLHDVYRDVFSVPGTNSQDATNLLDQRFPSQQDPTASIVFSAKSGELTRAADKTAIASVLDAVQRQAGVANVTDPFGAAPRVSSNGRIAVATVSYHGSFSDLPKAAFDDLERAATPARAAGIDVEYGGAVVDIQNSQSSGAADLIGVAAAVLILLFLFGTLLAAILPIGVALIAVGVSSMTLLVLASHVTIGTVAPILGAMIGLGVGIDYSLLVVSRYLQNRDTGMAHIEAIGHSLGTAGAASLFAGCCVAMALCGLVVAGIPYVATLGYSAALFVAVMVVAALTLLPAVLAVTGERITRHHRNVERAEDVGGVWYRFAHAVANRAGLSIGISVLLLALLASPLLDLHLGFADDGNAPTSLTQRRAYDLISQGFGNGANAPLLVAIALPAPTAPGAAGELADVEKLVGAIGTSPDVASVTPPIPSPTKNAAIVIVTPKHAPNVASTQQLVRTLRRTTIPQATAGTALAGNVFVGGQTASLIDVTDRISDRLLACIGIVVAGAFLLLMVVFRSLLVPLKAAAMNLLSIGAAYGVIVAVFQWGWGRELIGVHQAIPIVAFIPLMMFAILFGLSMDYEVFLLSRIREEYLRLGDAREAVAVGVAKTARVITAAAGIMIAVFLGFVLNPQPTVKMMGVGMAAAVLVDATIVRLFLVPAVMRFLGPAAWWLPKWLDRILPHLDLEGSPERAPTVTAPSGGGLVVEGAPAIPAPVSASASDLADVSGGPVEAS
jgi:putative drug exporter of the RND superfamily